MAAPWVPHVTGSLVAQLRSRVVGVGAVGELRRGIAAADVAAYAALLGDANPAHSAVTAAGVPGTGARFGGRAIAHGMIAGGLFATVFGATCPGALYVSQRLAFKSPTFVGDAVVARVVVTAVRALGRGRGTLVTCTTEVHEEGTARRIIEGEAVVLLPAPDGDDDGGGGSAAAGGGARGGDGSAGSDAGGSSGPREASGAGRLR